VAQGLSCSGGGCSGGCCSGGCCSGGGHSYTVVPSLPNRNVYKSFYSEDPSVRVRFHSNVTVKVNELVRCLADLCRERPAASAFVRIPGALRSLIGRMHVREPVRCSFCLIPSQSQPRLC
jgi:hypothetical protein